MATATTNTFVGPQDGWVQVAPATTAFLRVSAVPHTHQIYVYVGAAAPTDPLNPGILVCHKPFWCNAPTGQPTFVRVPNPVGDSTHRDGRARIDVLSI